MKINSKPDLEIIQMKRLAASGYFIGLHVRFASPLIVLHSYSDEWINYYTENAFVLHDPAITWAMGDIGCLRWSALPVPDPKGIFSAAGTFGLKFGVTCSWGPAGSRSIGNFARADREFTDEEMSDLFAAFQRLHDLTLPTDELTQPQIEALRCIANGDRHVAAAAKLGISESALKARIASARARLGARTTAEAIQRAKEYRLI